MSKSQKTQTAAVESTELHACECHKWSIEVWTGEVPEGADPSDYVEYETTRCGAETTRIFAPGHDAKLKSLMIKAGAAGREMRLDEGGMATFGHPVTMAARFGFEHQVAAGIRRAVAKAKARLAKKAAKRTAKAEKSSKRAIKPLVDPVTIKVGRWIYKNAIVNPADNSAEYTSANGDVKTAEAGKYQIVTA